MATKTGSAPKGGTANFEQTEGWTKLEPKFQAGLQQLMNHCGIRPVSGYRSHERQQQLWDAALKKYGSAKAARHWVALPGHSVHEHGGAADMEGTDAQMDCAHANAARFGLRFPMKHEPWHVELAAGNTDPLAYTPPPGQRVPEDTQDPLARMAKNLHAIFGAGGVDTDISGIDLSRPEELVSKAGDAIAGAMSNAGVPADAIGRFITALKAVESGGHVFGKQNYKAIGTQTPYGIATGAAQWLDSTWNNYAGYKRAADAPPDVQERRLREDVERLLKKHNGDYRKVAMEWHGGPDTKQWGRKTQKYATDVLGLYGGA